MNVLIFVTTMLMLLSLMTYARLESYRSSQAFQIIFKHYMQEKERGYINGQAEEVYKSIVVKEKEKEEGTKKSPAIDASPRIAIGLLFDSKREGKDWDQTRVLLKNLIKNLYANQPFYQKIEQGRPAFIDDLLSAVTQAIDDLPSEKKPKKAADLAHLKLADPVLDDLLYKILHGAFYMDIVTDGQQQVEDQQNDSNKYSEDDIATTEDDNEGSNGFDEYKSPEGYYSLLDYVTAKKKPRIRVYLASRNVLLAVFQEPATVNAIINERESLYHQTAGSKQMDMEQLNETFKNQFEKLRDPAIEPDTLNFSVSKTNPKYYR